MVEEGKDCIVMSLPLIAFSKDASQLNPLRWAVRTEADSLRITYNIRQLLHLPESLQLSVVCWLYPAMQFVDEKLWEILPVNVAFMSSFIPKGQKIHSISVYDSRGVIEQLPWPIEPPNMVIEDRYIRLYVLPFIISGSCVEIKKWAKKYGAWNRSVSDEDYTKRISEMIQPLRDYYKISLFPLRFYVEDSAEELSTITSDLQSEGCRLCPPEVLSGPYEAVITFYGEEDYIKKVSVGVVDSKRRIVIDSKSWLTKDYDMPMNEAADALMDDVFEYCKRSGVGKVISLDGPFPLGTRIPWDLEL